MDLVSDAALRCSLTPDERTWLTRRASCARATPSPREPPQLGGDGRARGIVYRHELALHTTRRVRHSASSGAICHRTSHLSAKRARWRARRR
mmetsp:Transcript_4185/g.12948  ORF Transcript_4185/g.12948 Transcript_4185/m.12948 type:complete len:92 (-) Transcript_4185:189-464(-)